MRSKLNFIVQEQEFLRKNMIFSFFKKKPIVPLEAGELVEFRMPVEKGFRLLYGKVHKISKKRNIFLIFASKDKGEDLQIGVKGVLTAIHTGTLVRFDTQLLHRYEDQGIFIFSPPETFVSKRVPRTLGEAPLALNLPIEYRAMASLHMQKGKLIQLSSENLMLEVNLPIPPHTVLMLEIPLPWSETPVRMKGKVISCERSSSQQKKSVVKTTLDEISDQDKGALLWFSLISLENEALKMDEKESAGFSKPS
jgi:hypothetical protein